MNRNKKGIIHPTKRILTAVGDIDTDGERSFGEPGWEDTTWLDAMRCLAPNSSYLLYQDEIAYFNEILIQNNIHYS